MENQLCSGNDDGEVDRCGRRRSDGGCEEEAVQNVSLDEFCRLILETQPKKRHMGASQTRRQIHGVPPQLRQQMELVYDPEMVSLGPYHHGKPELGRAEEFKYVCLDWCARGNEKKKGFLYNKVLERIDGIRSSYAEVTIVDKYDDRALALMMILDACFIVNFMDSGIGKKENNIVDWLDCLGLAASIPFMTRDIMVIENQLPFFVIQLLMSLLYIEREAEEILGWFFSWMTKVDLNEQATVPVIAGGNEQLQIHLLEACWRVIVLQTPYVAPSQHVPDQLLEKPNFSLRVDQSWISSPRAFGWARVPLSLSRTSNSSPLLPMGSFSFLFDAYHNRAMFSNADSDWAANAIFAENGFSRMNTKSTNLLI